MEKINVSSLTNTYPLKARTIYNFTDTTFNLPNNLGSLFYLENDQTVKSDIITIENLTLDIDIKLFNDNNIKYIRFINCNISGFTGELASSTSIDTIIFKNCKIIATSDISGEDLFNFSNILYFSAINCYFKKTTSNTYNLLQDYDISFIIVTSNIDFDNSISSTSTNLQKLYI
jgi:hypothetical protein